MSTVTTSSDVRDYVIRCLDGLHGHYDVPGIVEALRESDWWPVPDRPVTVLDDMPDFWDVVAGYDLHPDFGGAL